MKGKIWSMNEEIQNLSRETKIVKKITKSKF